MKTKRLGEDPFALHIPPTPDAGAAAGSPAASSTVQIGFRVQRALMDQVRDAVIALSGPPAHLSITEFTARAFRHELERLEREHNGGKPFPSRGEARLRPGRRVGT